VLFHWASTIKILQTSVHALKSELKDKNPTPPKETEQSILYKILNERINQLKIWNSNQ
jgi:hypothetical protein